jgi:murein DD-endopeptidase MepM/ murein hydrolase activator NlpD
MTALRLAALGISIVVLIAAVWLVFVGFDTTPRPDASALGAVASPGSSPDSANPVTPPASALGVSPGPTSSGNPSAEPGPLNPLAKQVPAHSVDPKDLTGYVWPARNALLTTRFAPEDPTAGGFVLIDGVPYHDGIDLATHCDDKLHAAHDGTVLYAGRNFDPFLGYQGTPEAIYARLQQLGRTNEQPIVVVIDDGNGYRSEYVHLNEADVEAGQVVHAGDVIGLEGATGFASGCHLHYTLIRTDGGWQQVVPRLLQFGYPPLVRERVDPLDVLPWGDQYAPQRLKDKVNPPSPGPTDGPTVSPN